MQAWAESLLSENSPLTFTCVKVLSGSSTVKTPAVVAYEKGIIDARVTWHFIKVNIHS